MKHRTIELCGRDDQLKSWLGSGALGVLIGAVPALFVYLFGTRGAGALVTWPVALAVLAPFVWGMQKIMGRLNPELRIGADGISLQGGGTSAMRFIPFGQLDGIEAVRYAVHRGHWIGVRVMRGGQSDTLGRLPSLAAAERVVEEVLEAKARWASTRTPFVGLAALESAGAPVSEWLEALRARANDDATYRDAVLGPDQLIELVESGAATVEQRVGAAVVLAAKQGETAHERIRVAAQTTANPKLRVALTSIAAGEIEQQAVEEALAEERPRPAVREPGPAR